jgi:hypothetical protein
LAAWFILILGQPGLQCVDVDWFGEQIASAEIVGKIDASTRMMATSFEARVNMISKMPLYQPRT